MDLSRKNRERWTFTSSDLAMNVHLRRVSPAETLSSADAIFTCALPCVCARAPAIIYV